MKNRMKPLTLPLAGTLSLAMTFSLVMTALSLGGCSSEEGEASYAGSPGHRAALEVLGASQGELQLTAPGTRATSTTLTSGKIGVFLNPKTPGDYTPQNNVKYTASNASGGGTAWTSSKALFFTDAIANVCAYHPYTAGGNYEDRTAMRLKTQEYSAAVDFSFAKDVPMNSTDRVANGSEDGAGNQVVFKMSRAYALLVLNFKRGNIKDDCTIARMEVSATGLNSENTLNISTGAYGSPTAAPDNKFILDKEITVPQNTSTASVSQQILMVPAATLSNMKLTLKLNSAGSPALGVKVTEISRFEAGKRYTLNLTVNSTGIAIGSMQVTTGWDDEPLKNDDGSADLVPV